jgi:hypothetical protein
MKISGKGHPTSFFFLLVALVFVAASFNLDTRPRFIPLCAGIFTLVVMVLVLINDLFPATFLKRLNAGLLDSYNPTPPSVESNEGDRLKNTAVVLGWMGFFFLLILIFGFAIAIPVFTFSFLKVRGKTGWAGSLLAACLVTAAVVVIFKVLMGISLFEGVIGGEILPPV